VLTAESYVCEECGAWLGETPGLAELRGIVYLLSELQSWEAQGLIAVEEAATLRSRYELRREALRAQISADGEQAESSAPPLPANEASTAPGFKASTTEAASEAERARPIPAGSTTQPQQHPIIHALLSRLEARAPKPGARAASERAPRRSLFETLADPYALRLLLYTGAAMLVVAVVLWLRDALYLKLREPLVQAVLLAFGTIAVLVFGWLMTLRTRLRLTGRALTLIGALLVPVNFWFLARSGLIDGNGRAWMVCALCAVLYGLTAALLRERLYVYLACVASFGVAWALVYRATPEAYGLYSLTLMSVSLVFLHLSRVFPPGAKQNEKADAANAGARAAKEDDGQALRSRRSYELWGLPLVRVALAGAGASATLYMLLRPGASPSLAEGAFRWHASAYDARVAVLLFVAGAYVAWFAARFIDKNRGAVLYTTSALALWWAEFLVLDGLRVRGQAQLMALTATALVVAFAARLLPERVMAEALHRATAAVLTLLFLLSGIIALILHLAPTELEGAWRPSVFFVLAATIAFGALGGGREGGRSIYGAGLATAAALVLAAAALDALQAASLLPSEWPIAGGVICAAFLPGWIEARRKPGKGVAESEDECVPSSGSVAIDTVVSLVLDGAVMVCALLWLARTLSLTEAVAGRAVFVLLPASLYWTQRAAQARRALFVYLASGSAGALLLALLMALGVERRWMASVFALALFPALFAPGHWARGRGLEWLARAAGRAAAVVAALVGVALMLEAAPVLQAGDERLLAPLLTAGALGAVTLAASLFSVGPERVRYFRAGLGAAVATFVFAVLRAGYDPLIDVEMYTSPVAAVLLIVAALSVRREWDEYALDTSLLLWAGSLLLCGPLLLRALQFRLLLDVPAPWRELGVLGVALALLLFGLMNRLRAPVIVGTMTLLLELVVLALTSVHWLQVPLWKYLVTAGTLIIIIWGMFENRREQLLLVRQRLHERSASARARFNEWR
jgi:hypothetical protein